MSADFLIRFENEFSDLKMDSLANPGHRILNRRNQIQWICSKLAWTKLIIKVSTNHIPNKGFLYVRHSALDKHTVRYLRAQSVNKKRSEWKGVKKTVVMCIISKRGREISFHLLHFSVNTYTCNICESVKKFLFGFQKDSFSRGRVTNALHTYFRCMDFSPFYALLKSLSLVFVSSSTVFMFKPILENVTMP